MPRAQASEAAGFIADKGYDAHQVAQMISTNPSAAYWRALWARYHDLGGNISAADGRRVRTPWAGPPPAWRSR